MGPNFNRSLNHSPVNLVGNSADQCMRPRALEDFRRIFQDLVKRYSTAQVVVKCVKFRFHL